MTIENLREHKLKYALLSTLLFVWLTGCNRQQQVQANNDAHQAGNKIQQAAADAKKGLANSSLTLKVKTAMGSSEKLDTSGINVDSKDGVVYLRGQAATADQKALAERIAKDTVGPNVRIISELAIRPTATARQVQ